MATEPNGNPPWSRKAEIADYGGATDKANSSREAPEPYAATYYRDLTWSLYGDYRTKNPTGLVHCENVATARYFAGLRRFGDLLRNNNDPASAADKIDDWVEIYKIPIRRWYTLEDKRAICSAHHRLLSGLYREAVEDACESLLGDLFVRLWFIVGTDLNNPPTNTFWTGINPGSPADNLGGGTWLSERAHVIVEVVPPSGKDLERYLDRVNTQLYHLLSSALPIYMTFDWTSNVEDGFELDADQLDFGALGGS